MVRKKEILIGLIDGIGVGVYLPWYLTKKFSRRNIYSTGEEIDKGRLSADMYVDRNSLEYRLIKSIGKGLGTICAIPTLFLPGIIFDIINNGSRRQKDYS